MSNERKTKIGLICNVWDDPEGVERILNQPTIFGFDYLIFIDGQFSNYKGECEYGLNDVRDCVELYKSIYKSIPIYYENVEGLTEAEKRDYSFKVAMKLGMDFALVCDADEIPYINREEFDSEVESLLQAEWGCYAIMLDNYKLEQRRPRLFDLREKPYLLQEHKTGSHSHIYSELDGRDMAVDITECLYTVSSITLKHNKEFYSKYRFDCRHEYGLVPNH